LAAAGWILLILAIAAASHGRAVASFRAFALAGAAPSALVGPEMFFAVRTLATSHFAAAVIVLALLAIALARGSFFLPLTMLIGALCSSTIVLMTPGTVFTSQAVEPYIAAVVALFSSDLPARGRIGSLVVAALLVWAAARDVR